MAPSVAAAIHAAFGEKLSPVEVVDRILEDIDDAGDAAVHRYGELLDGVSRDELRVERDEIERLPASVAGDVHDALEFAATRVRRFHEAQPIGSWMDWREHEALGQILRPIDRVGLYAPGGATPLPSSLLMAGVTARVAGVPQLVVYTPPRWDGTIAPVIAAASLLVDADEVYAVGGAQAIGAMAYGTASIPAVDKIGGPGSLFTVLALRRVYGRVGIVSLPGPTETLLIADDSVEPAWIAADLLAEAEHDVLASAVLITPRETSQPRFWSRSRSSFRRWNAATSRASLQGNGAIIVVGDIDQAIELANVYAPEHLCLLVRDPWPLTQRAVRVACSSVRTRRSPSATTSPGRATSCRRTARFSSPVNLWDFVTITSVFWFDQVMAEQLTAPASAMANAEELTAHAAALRHRFADQPSKRPR